MPRIAYPRLVLLCMCFVLAYLFAEMGLFDEIHAHINGYGYISVFFAGLLFSYGFTTPFAIAMFLEFGEDTNILIAAPLAGLGAVTADSFIMSVMRFSLFHEEIVRLRRSTIANRIRNLLRHRHVTSRMREYILWSFAGLVIASPLPDELGVAMVSSIADVDRRWFTLLCFLFNTAGITFFLLLA